ncbi:DUF1003 domain-containing protein [bacterium]|nr:DUF1003 domain-containing protein [bacterium]
MADNATPMVDCPVCHKQHTAAELINGAFVRPSLVAQIREHHPDWTPEQPVCHECLDAARAEYIAESLASEKGELSSLEQEVVAALESRAFISTDTNAEFEEKTTFGQHIADRLADTAGSWGFIIGFGIVLVAWIALNSIALFARPFDPFPFILLNLVLSCLAAIQAPVIMMSQNRQEARDRLRAEHDYQVNLKAELEIKQLHEKIDHIMTRQWERLTEIQSIQVDLMNELLGQGRTDGNTSS